MYVADTKYKMLIYCQRDDDAPPRSITVGAHQMRFDTWALKLSGSPADIERRLGDLADQIIERQQLPDPSPHTVHPRLLSCGTWSGGGQSPAGHGHLGCRGARTMDPGEVPDGVLVPVEQRLAEIRDRYGPGTW